MRTVADKLNIDPRAALGLLVLAGGIALWGMSFLGGGFSLFGGSKTTVKADFASVQYIVANDPVRINGVFVGRVTKTEASPRGDGGTLTMELEDSAGKIYQDATATIQWRTALGANEAVSLTPGTPAAGELGARVIPQSQTANQVELDQITQAIHGDAQPGLQSILKEFGPALTDEENLGRGLEVLADVAPNAARGIGALRGQVRDTDLRELVKNAGQAADAMSVGTGASETQAFVESAAVTLNAIDPIDLRNTLQRAAADLEPSERMFAHLDKILYNLDPLVPKLQAVAPRAAVTLRKLRPLLVNTSGLLRDADPLLERLRPTLHSLERTARIGGPVIDELSPSLKRIDTDILPGLEQVYPEENLPVYKLIGPTIVGLGTLSNFFDANGNLANLTAGLMEPQSAQLLPCSLDFSGTNFLVCSSLSDALSLLFGGSPAMLRELAGRPHGAAIYGPLLENQLRIKERLNDTMRKLEKVRPEIVRHLFQRKGGQGG